MRLTQRAVDGAPIGARRDVVEHELVGAFVAIARRERHDVADDAVVAKLHAFDDDAVADVEAGDYAPRKNGRISSGCEPAFEQRFARNGRRDARVAASAARSATSRTPPDAWNCDRRPARARSRGTARRSGPSARRRGRCPCTARGLQAGGRDSARSRRPASASRRASSRASRSAACRRRRAARRAPA